MLLVFYTCLLHVCNFIHIIACLVRWIDSLLCSHVRLSYSQCGGEDGTGKGTVLGSICLIVPSFSHALNKDGVVADSRGWKQQNLR